MKKASELNIKEIEQKIGYTFKDKSLLTQAFTRTSFCNETNPTAKVKYHSNEVLEFFGDGVLSLSIISFLLKECTERYEHGIRTELDEGDFSNIKSKLSDKQNLSKSMKALGLEKHLLMGEGDLKLGIQNEPSVMEDLFESIIGAIFIDSDMSIRTVMDVVSGMLDTSIYTNRQRITQSAKNALQEWCADKKRRLPTPRYETLSEDGPDHKKTYMRACYIGDKLVGRGIGKNFKLADAAAAEDALKSLMAEEERFLQSEVVKNNYTPVNSMKSVQKTPNVKSTANRADAPEEKVNTSTAQKAQKKEVTPTVKLKNYAISNKMPSPVFKDLGQSGKGEKAEYKVECVFMNESAIGIGPARIEARESASRLVAERLGIIKKKQPKSAPKKQGQTAKKSASSNAQIQNKRSSKRTHSKITK